jgi:MFS family permease
MVVFTLGSVACALSASAVELIAARAFQGVGGAMMSALALSILSPTYSGKARACAIGIWATCAGLGFGLGPDTTAGQPVQHPVIGAKQAAVLRHKCALAVTGSRGAIRSRAGIGSGGCLIRVSRWLQWVWASKCSAHADTGVVRAP